MDLTSVKSLLKKMGESRLPVNIENYQQRKTSRVSYLNNYSIALVHVHMLFFYHKEEKSVLSSSLGESMFV